MSCGIGLRCSGQVLLWLWWRPVAAALIHPPARELPYAAGAALKRRKTVVVVGGASWHDGTQQGPVGSWAQAPHVLFLGNKLQPPGPSPSPKGQVPTGADLEGKGCRDPEGMAGDHSAAWGQVLVPPQGTHTAMSLSPSAELNQQQMRVRGIASLTRRHFQTRD